MGLHFLSSEDGQDLIEYTLLLCFVVFGLLFIMRDTGSALTPIWQNSNNTLQSASAAVS